VIAKISDFGCLTYFSFSWSWLGLLAEERRDCNTEQLNAWGNGIIMHQLVKVIRMLLCCFGIIVVAFKKGIQRELCTAVVYG
jgi:hypothetical protein